MSGSLSLSDTTVTRICGTCLLLSGLLGLAAPPIAIGLGLPVFVDFGDGETLSRFAALAPAPFLFALWQVSMPTLAMASSLGFYYLLQESGSAVVLGVVLNSLGLVFTTIQDGIEVTLTHYLPAAYVAAASAERPAPLALGDVGATAMGVFGRLGSVAFLGMMLINLAMWWRGGRWKLLGALGIGADVVILGAVILSALFSQLSIMGIGFPIGFIALRVWMILAAVAMWRWTPEAPVGSRGAILV
jgi:hypothetical protein